jgi:hypothetical protein
MIRVIPRLLAPMLLFLTACGGGAQESSTASTTSQPLTTVAQSSTPTALAGCQPRTVTFEPDTDGPLPETPVLPDDDDGLAAAVADAFCSPEWKIVLLDGTYAVTARRVLPSDDAACIGDQLVEVLGATRVKELWLGAGPWSLVVFGLSNNSGERQIERAEAGSIVEIFMECSEQWKLLLILSVTEGADKISDESAACVAARLADDDAMAMLISEIDRAYDDPSQPNAQPFADSIEPLIAAFDDCLSPEERDNLDFD